MPDWPAGRGLSLQDDGRTLAHVTVAHTIDPQLKHQLYSGNPQSFILVNIDLKTHVGRIDVHRGQPVEARNHIFDDVEVCAPTSRRSGIHRPTGSGSGLCLTHGFRVCAPAMTFITSSRPCSARPRSRCSATLAMRAARSSGA